MAIAIAPDVRAVLTARSRFEITPFVRTGNCYRLVHSRHLEGWTPLQKLASQKPDVTITEG